MIIRFSIPGAFYTGIAKNARVRSHRYDITYARTASNVPPEIQVDHYMCTCKHLCIIHLLFVPPPCTWDRGITKILKFPSAKPCTMGALVTVSAYQHVPRSTSVLLGSKPDISKALPTLTRVPIYHCYHRSHETMVALLKYGLNISKIGISFELLNCIVTENIFLIKCIDLFLLLFWLSQNLDLYCGRTDRHTDKQAEGWRANLIESWRYSIFAYVIGMAFYWLFFANNIGGGVKSLILFFYTQLFSLHFPQTLEHD